ncbi:Hypothetical protein A7982_04462 [Minicystis rosea]|nr:Hypothetical protein A7982_04462 [Minicystis rosea]
MRAAVPFCSFALSLALFSGCSKGSYDPTDDLRPTEPPKDLPENTEFELVPEYEGPCEARATIDVNLGHAPEAFVRAAHCQIHGTEPSPDLVSSFSDQLRNDEWVRRIDVVRILCNDAGKSCPLAYTDPWKEQVLLTTPCERKTTRDVGAVLMFFSECPGGVNCDLDWANTHVRGMDSPHRLYGFGEAAEGYYHPDNAGFWKRELVDARWAGLQFLLVNTYGPDLQRLGRLTEALADVGGGIKIAFLDDTWSWRSDQPPPWSSVPNLSDADAAAQTIYQAKWRRFYQAIPQEHWYLVKGRPFLYFYNAGTLKPLNAAAGVVSRLKQLFAADFGVEPFVAVDRAFFEDPGMPAVADSEFTWNTFGHESHYKIKDVTHDHFMVRWDSLGRDHPGEIATESDRVVKGPELLIKALETSAASDVAVFGTWNDLGEGTGINRNYDYYDHGAWLGPHAFMSLVRAAQCK